MASVVLSDAEKLYIIHGVQVTAVLLYSYVKVAFRSLLMCLAWEKETLKARVLIFTFVIPLSKIRWLSCLGGSPCGWPWL